MPRKRSKERFGFTPAGQVEVWSRWRRGETLAEIGRAFDKHAGSVLPLLRSRGGIPPAPRRARPDALTLAEREEVSRGLHAGESLREIAARLGRAPSSVCREVARNGGRAAYRAAAAQAAAALRALRPKACKLALNPRLRSLVALKLTADWSPEQISGWLREAYPDDEGMRVSHEAIYRTLFVQARGALKRELTKHLRSRRAMRRPRAPAGSHDRIPDLVSISQRPAEVDDRAVPGHWEGDLLVGGNNSHVATLVERSTRYVLLRQVGRRDASSVTQALIDSVKDLPAHLRRSLTWDRGTEMAQHVRFTLATDVKVFFCDPYSPWQRGSNENTNGLLRQYLPKGVDLAAFDQAQLDEIALKLNTRPRKTLGYRTPAAMLAEAAVALTL